MMTMMVLKMSEAECTASETIAPDRAIRPAASFATDSSRFTAMLTAETRSASLGVFSMRSPPKYENPRDMSDYDCPADSMPPLSRP